jgi:hypothetical protein
MVVYLASYPVSVADPCCLSDVLDLSSAADSGGGCDSAEGVGGGRAVAFQPLRNEAIAAARPKSETHV